MALIAPGRALELPKNSFINARLNNRNKQNEIMNLISRLRTSLLAKFSLVALFITAAIAIALAWGIQRQQEQNALQQAALMAADQVKIIINPSLTPADLVGPLKPEQYERIDTLIRQNILSERLVRVKIWSRDGMLLYSDEKDKVGNYFPISDDLEAALGGNISSEITNLEREENISERERYQRLLEVYAPLQPQNLPSIAGAYEIYHDLSDVEPGIAAMRRYVTASVSAGFLILYGALFILVRNASRELVRRNKENSRLFKEEQSRRTELAALYDISRTLADAAPESDTILDIVVHRAVETVHATFARVLLLENEHIVERAAHPIRALDRQFEIGQREPVRTQTLCQNVMEGNEAVVFRSESAASLTERERGLLFLDLVKTLCLVPLHMGERPLGILVLGEARSDKREPFSPEKVRLARSIGDQTASALQRAEFFEQLERSYLETVQSLAKAVEAKDTYTANHAENIAKMTLAVGREGGMTQDELENLRYGAILHDVGKIGIPDTVLKKAGKLEEGEWEEMRRHPAIGARILSSIPRLAGAAQIIRHHHERYDGTGYPDGLAGEAIPLGARVLTVVDSYSAIVDERVYKKARSHKEAVAELKRCAGTQFDPRVVETFLKLIERGAIKAEAGDPKGMVK